jgi:hypothetical protein
MGNIDILNPLPSSAQVTSLQKKIILTNDHQFYITQLYVVWKYCAIWYWYVHVSLFL